MVTPIFHRHATVRQLIEIVSAVLSISALLFAKNNCVLYHVQTYLLHKIYTSKYFSIGMIL